MQRNALCVVLAGRSPAHTIGSSPPERSESQRVISLCQQSWQRIIDNKYLLTTLLLFAVLLSLMPHCPLSYPQTAVLCPPASRSSPYHSLSSAPNSRMVTSRRGSFEDFFPILPFSSVHRLNKSKRHYPSVIIHCLFSI